MEKINSCVSCKVIIKEGFTYCYNCNKQLDKLNTCKGITLNQTPCKLKCTGEYCKYHGNKKKEQNDTYLDIVKKGVLNSSNKFEFYTE